MGVTIVAVTRYAVVTQAWTLNPCRSLAILTMAVPTIVWSSAPRNTVHIKLATIARICRRVSAGGPVPAGDAAAPDGTGAGAGSSTLAVMRWLLGLRHV